MAHFAKASRAKRTNQIIFYGKTGVCWRYESRDGRDKERPESLRISRRSIWGGRSKLGMDFLIRVKLTHKLRYKVAGRN